MPDQLDRREFLRMTTAATAGMALAGTAAAQTTKPDGKPEKTVRLGIIGFGNRGRGLTAVILGMKGVQVPAVCDIRPDALKLAKEWVVKAGQPEPAGYGDDPEAYKKLVARDDLDAVLIATPWPLHTPMAVAAMKAGKYAASEVPCAIDMQQCWDLVNTHEETGVPCMMLENWSYRRDNLAVLNMIRQGLFGQIVHCHCAHSHDCIDHFFYDPQGNKRWPGDFLIERNRDQYPTHSLGPVLSWMDINCGDAYDTITATASDPVGIYAYFKGQFGPDCPALKTKFKQGDIVTSVIRTKKGKTIVINYDMQLPRPYDNRWLIQGTVGLYREDPSTVYILGKSPKYHEWEPFGPYQEKYDHKWWREFAKTAEAAGHGGTDWIELKTFFDAVRNKTQTPIDVYDSVTMSAISPLSEESIAKGSAPIKCPDFTKGKWETRKPTFAVEA
jgi:predicted dehydrogenase